MACVILASNQATDVNSIAGYNATILIQAGLSDVAAHWGCVILTSVNYLVAMISVMLVDRKGRKLRLSPGSGGIIVSLLGEERDRTSAQKRSQTNFSRGAPRSGLHP